MLLVHKTVECRTGRGRFYFPLLGRPLLLVLCAAVSACTRHHIAPEKTHTAAPSVGAQRVTLDTIGISTSAMDTAVQPCDDFFQYSCGGWLKQTEIPAEESRWSRSFSEINKRLELQLKDILEGLVQQYPQTQGGISRGGAADGDQKKLALLYQGCVDTAALDKSTPLKTLSSEVIGSIDAMTSTSELAGVIGKLHRIGVNVAFSIAPEQDFEDATQMIAEFDQSGLGLPDREYYLSDDKKKSQIRQFYRAHINKVMSLSGTSKEDRSAVIFKIEAALAKAAQDRVTRRKPEAVYHPDKPTKLSEYLPNFDWTAYFAAIGLPNMMSAKRINFTSTTYFAELSKVIKNASLTAWKAYLKWHVLHSFGDHLDESMRTARFELRQKLTGQQKNRARWKRCISLTNSLLGDVLGREFVARHFAKESKEAVTAMIHGVRKAFAANLADLDWIDDDTRATAATKSTQMEFLVGYPSKWRSYPYEAGDSYIVHMLRARENEVAYDLKKIGAPVDRTLWSMSPSTVNAYYNPLKNHMVFPAGILQPPFYDRRSAFAVNMGSLGMIVGHELTHGFDDQGSKFDGDGNMKGWWSATVRSRFETQTACIEKQYSSFDALQDTKLNGALTLGENIADAGGIKLAFSAYRSRVKSEAALDRGTVEGFSSDQQFFVAAAQSWCAKYRPEYAAMLVQVDPHSPPKFRINGTLSNMPEFAAAFSCTDTSNMTHNPQCSVW